LGSRLTLALWILFMLGIGFVQTDTSYGGQGINSTQSKDGKAHHRIATAPIEEAAQGPVARSLR
jgi:hypothetical protein